MFDSNYKFTCIERFLKYVKYDTQSNEESETFPSDPKQIELSKFLVQELKNIGLNDAVLDKYGYVVATLPSNTSKNVPVIGFISHVDTSPAVSGTNVNPIIYKNYRGGDIVLPGNPSRIIDAAGNPELKSMIGLDIITTDGTTLLGADDKAGIAEIIDALDYLIRHPELKHGKIRVCFTPDEEVGRGTEKFDVEKFGAQYAYTVDGSTRGEVESETFSADGVTIRFNGRNMHPGYAKGKMINAVKIATSFLEMLPKETLSPETTDKREGYVHPMQINGNETETVVKFIIRDFYTDKLKEFEEFLRTLCEKAVALYPGSSYQFEVTEQYRNMKYILDQYPQVEQYAIEALNRLGIEPINSSIRGGTDGSRLSYMGLPAPNLFAGGHNFHAYTEYVAVQDMEAAVKMIVTITQVWEEKS